MPRTQPAISPIRASEPPPGLARVRAFAVILLIAMASLIARLWFLQIVEGDELLAQSEINHIRVIRIVAPRGLIEDRNGAVLATNRSEIVVSVVPAEVRQAPGVLDRLAMLLNMPAAYIQGILRDNTVNENEPVRVAEDVGLDIATRVEEQRLDLPGVTIGSEPVRYYPDGPIFGHVLGQMGQVSREDLKALAKQQAEAASRRSNDSADPDASAQDAAVAEAVRYHPGDYCGKLGLERAFDADLRGTDGGRRIEVDAHGRMRGELSSIPPVPGARLILTLDRGVQEVAYKGLAQLAARGLPGAAVALDPETGAVLALVSTPSYDPNLFVGGISAKDWKRYHDDRRHPLVNRAVGAAMAPGSTFKIVTSSAALQTGCATENTTIDCPGFIRLGHWIKHCHKASGHGLVDMVRAIQVSCDVFFYRMGQRLGPDRLAEYARRFGLGRRTGIDLPHVESAGVVPDPAWKLKHYHEPWVGGDTVDYAIGQSMLACTPLQMCNVAAAVANGGTLYRPQLVGAIDSYGPGGAARETFHMRPEVISKVGLSPETLRIVREGMQRVMEPGGTGARSAIPGVQVAGKTGTAQHRVHGVMRTNAWFVAYAPMESPRIAVCVFVENGGEGGVVCAPIARAMIARYLGIKLH